MITTVNNKAVKKVSLQPTQSSLIFRFISCTHVFNQKSILCNILRKSFEFIVWFSYRMDQRLNSFSSISWNTFGLWWNNEQRCFNYWIDFNSRWLGWNFIFWIFFERDWKKTFNGSSCIPSNHRMDSHVFCWEFNAFDSI